MAHEFYNFVTIQMAGDDESPISPDVVAKSQFFKAAFQLRYDRIIGPGADDVNTDALGSLWHDVEPVDGRYTFEIATVLPFYLPYFDGAPEYAIEVDGAEIVVSSRMLMCFFSDEKGQASPLQYYLVHRRGLASLLDQKHLTHIHPVPLRAFVATQLSIEGAMPKQIIQTHFYSWIRQFVARLSRFLDSVRAASPTDAKHLLPQSATRFLPIFWISILGRDGKHGIQQFAGDMPSAAFRSLANLDKDAVNTARKFLTGGSTIPVHDASLALATTYLHYGYLGLALVQVCIACESVLAQNYETFLTSRGVSKNKYAEAEKDITFSQLLNLHLAAIRDLSKLEDRDQTLGKLNWARKCRNDVVHTGTLSGNVTNRDVEQAIESARKLVRFVVNPPKAAAD
jgi:hypothetical protein